MGKKKIPIEFIEDPRKRKLCFDKRQQGLLKKAMEIVKLAHVDVGLIIMSEEANSLVEFWSGDKTNLVKRYQDLAVTPHYDFTIGDYEREISNALALRPFHEQTRLREQAIRQYGFPVYNVPQPNTQLYEENRPLKRQRFQLDDEASSCYSSQPSSPTPTLAPTGALNSLKSLETDLAKLCDAGVPQLHSARVTPIMQPSSPTSTTSNTTCNSIGTPPPTSSNMTVEMDNNLNLGISEGSCLGDIDVSGLLEYIGKLENAQATSPNNVLKPDDRYPSAPTFNFQFGGSGSVWEGGSALSAFC